MYSPGQLSAHLGVTNECLRKWEMQGKIKSVKTKGGGHRRYFYPQLEKNKIVSIIYARVCSSKQKPDLQRQIKFLKEKFPNYDVITDIGSGLNFKRKSLIKILELLFSGNIKEVVVAHKDRLSRFGYELFELIFQKHGAILTVYQDSPIERIDQFTQDILSIITIYTAKFYGSRKYKILQKN